MMLTASPVRDSIIVGVLAHYNLNYDKILPSQSGYRNHSHPVRLSSGELVNLIMYKHEPGIVGVIKTANQVSNFLAAEGFPARRSFDERIVRLGTTSPRYAALYYYLPGVTIPWEAYTMEHLKLLGGTMGEMHTLLQTETADSSIIETCGQLNDRMRNYFGDQYVIKALRDKCELRVHVAIFDHYTHLLRLASFLPEAQVLHMDFVRGNILFDRGDGGALKISGVLDFEKVAYGPRIFDVARTLAFLLVDCKYKSEGQVRKYFLASGYLKRGQQTMGRQYVRHNGQRYDVLEELISFFLLHDFYKFLRHNPYESLARNEHFLRTRDLLLARKLLTSHA